MEYHTKIAGIPCQVSFEWEGFDPIRVAEVFDRNGRSAPWLERKLTEVEADRIVVDFIAMMASQRDDYLYEMSKW